jgi:hypothetical protein
MENIGNRQYGLSIDGDVFYSLPVPEAAKEIAKRFYEGFKSNVIVLDVTENMPVDIGWQFDGSNFANIGAGQTAIDSVPSGQRVYAFIANNIIFGMIRLQPSDAQAEMFTAAFSTGGVIGVDVT